MLMSALNLSLHEYKLSIIQSNRAHPKPTTGFWLDINVLGNFN